MILYTCFLSFLELTMKSSFKPSVALGTETMTMCHRRDIRKFDAYFRRLRVSRMSTEI